MTMLRLGFFITIMHPTDFFQLQVISCKNTGVQWMVSCGKVDLKNEVK